MKKILLLMLLVILLSVIAGCMTERERRGVSYAPFNSPEGGTRRTFDGDM
jgi:hypothetical protein